MTAWQQHDVQELCRAMFDALELTWQNTSQSNIINELYEGKMKDCVQCLQVMNDEAIFCGILFDILLSVIFFLQCFDTFCWAAGRASGL